MSKEVVTRMNAPAQMQAPNSYSFDQVQRMAVSFAKSGLFGVKDADSAFALMMYAQATGKHPALIMLDYDLINNRLAKKSNAMLRDFQASGGRIDWIKYEDDGVTGVFTHPLSKTPLTVDWNMERAKKAGLAGKNGDMYSKYTRAMFRSRCISEGIRTIAPEATEQLYTAEEVREMEQEAPEPVSITQAVHEAAEQVTHQMDPERVDALITSLDVKTIGELIPAFGHAYTEARDARDNAAMERIKAAYETMKSALESEAI